MVELEDGEEIEAFAYVKNNLEWVKEPSEAYVQAICDNLMPFWKNLEGAEKEKGVQGKIPVLDAAGSQRASWGIKEGKGGKVEKLN